MELPFKYIVLYIIKLLNDRSMPLLVNKSNLIDFFQKIIDDYCLDDVDRNRIKNSFDFEYELERLFSCYDQYFELDGKTIVFDENYINELDGLIDDASNEYDKASVFYAYIMIDKNADFLEILNVNLNKDTYNCLIDIDKKLEEYYMTLSLLENNNGLNGVNVIELNNKIKKLKFKRMILIMNIKSILSKVEYNDFLCYAVSVGSKNNSFDDFKLLLKDDNFNKTTVMGDLFKQSIFLSDELCYASLCEKLVYNLSTNNKDDEYSKLKFYLTFLELLDEEINKREEVSVELVNIKYRLMYAIDSIYDSNIFTNRNILDSVSFKENYVFAQSEVYYFINELLMYDDDKYKNKEFDTDNIMVYTDSIVKMLLIKTYYKLTGDKKVIDTIVKNKLYGINGISSDFLKDIVDKPKTKIKEV